MNEKIHAALIFEMIGRPQEHLMETMNKLLEVIEKEKGVVITNKKIHEPKLVENKDKEGQVIPALPGSELFSTFSEVEVSTPDTLALLRLCLKFMPAHVEVIQPDDIEMNNYNVTAFLNELAEKLHHYDALAKSAMMQNQILAKRFQEMAQRGAVNKDEIQVIDKSKDKAEKKPRAKKKSKESIPL